MKLHVQEIKIGKRIRKEFGDLEELKESLNKHGLMNPVVVNKNKELIAGHRRLESAKLLGWEYIEVTFVETEDEASMLELEIEENIKRKNLSETELEEASIRLDKLRNPNILKRLFNIILEYIKKLFRKNSS